MTPRGILIRFTASVVIVLALTGTIGLWLLHDAATDEALQDARTETAEVARAVVAPLLARDPTDGALRRSLDRLVGRNALGASVRHVKVWSADGRVRYSSDPKLIGRRFVLDVDNDTVIFSNQIGDAGCVTVIGDEFALSLYRLDVSPGWTAESNSTSSGVRVTFTQTATGYKVSARIEPGRTDIRL